jgi:septum formation protein
MHHLMRQAAMTPVPITLRPPLWLGSRSPRRRLLLQQAGLEVHVCPSDLDDGDLPAPTCDPRLWVMALAYHKAARVARNLHTGQPGVRGTVLAADTVCVHDGAILGQPADADHAQAMLWAMRDALHETISGVCLMPLDQSPDNGASAFVPRILFVDVARVTVGHVADDAIEAYIRSGQWQGKAGGYNLSERIEAGWPIRCDGDPATVMGLPMRRLMKWLPALGLEMSSS